MSRGSRDTESYASVVHRVTSCPRAARPRVSAPATLGIPPYAHASGAYGVTWSTRKTRANCMDDTRL